MIFTSHSPEETQRIATDLAHKILKSGKGAVIAMEGELGAGKTTFIQGFAKALGITDKIKSPTFVLMKSYPIPSSDYSLVASRYLYHLDCYRISDDKDLKIPEFEEILTNPNNIVLVEWPERIAKILPKKHITVHIDHVEEGTRSIRISN